MTALRGTKKCAPLFFWNWIFFDGSPYFDFECRVVRFKISDDTYESIITNLDESEFNIQDIKELYHLRWEIETSYRELKYHLD